jgi:hypothetical protein
MSNVRFDDDEKDKASNVVSVLSSLGDKNKKKFSAYGECLMGALRPLGVG